MSRRISGTASSPCGAPPSRASAWAVAGEWLAWPRVALREPWARRNTVSAVSGIVSAFTASEWSKPRACHPTAALFLTMNIAARSTWRVTSPIRCVSTSDRLVPFSIAVIAVFRPL